MEEEGERDGSWRYRFVTTKCVSLAAVAIFALIEFGFNRQSALPLPPSSVRPSFLSFFVISLPSSEAELVSVCDVRMQMRRKEGSARRGGSGGRGNTSESKRGFRPDKPLEIQAQFKGQDGEASGRAPERGSGSLK